MRNIVFNTECTFNDDPDIHTDIERGNIDGKFRYCGEGSFKDQSKEEEPDERYMEKIQKE